MIKDIKDSDFNNEVVKADQPVMIDFWAPWCGPCKAILPVIEELDITYGDKVKFTKCNVDDNPGITNTFGVRSIPTLIFFKNGEVSDQIVGAVAKSKIEAAISKIL